MARYKKIDIRIWGDRQFRSLTPPPPGGQALWWRLMVPRESTNIPGLFVAGETSLAEHLRWSLEGFRAAFAEIESQGMAKADWSVGLVWVHNAIKYHSPESPNVVKSWRAPWDEIPECDLKSEAYQLLRRYIEVHRSEKYLIAFDHCVPEPTSKAFPKGLPKAFRKGVSKPLANQEQEQEQDKKGKGNSSAKLVSNRETLSSSPTGIPDGNDDDESYQNGVRRILRELPDAPKIHVNRKSLLKLRADGIELPVVEAACWLAIGRRQVHPGTNPIASFAYFIPVIREVFQNPLPAGYLSYLKSKLQQASIGVLAQVAE